MPGAVVLEQPQRLVEPYRTPPLPAKARTNSSPASVAPDSQNLVNDAHLAALAIEHGAELNSCDSDFSRFSGLRWINPLDSQ